VCTPLKNVQKVIHITLLNKQTCILLLIDREGSCVLKLELLMPTCIYCRDEMKERHAIWVTYRSELEKSHKMQP